MRGWRAVLVVVLAAAAFVAPPPATALDVGVLRLVSHGAGRPGPTTSQFGAGVRDISDDGRFVVFDSAAPDLAGVPDGNNQHDVFVWDRDTDAVTPVSVSPLTPRTLSGRSGDGFVSADGRYVTYETDAPLSDFTDVSDSGGGPTPTDIVQWDRTTRETRLVTVNQQASAALNGNSQIVDVSEDGGFVLFTTLATPLGTTRNPNAIADLYLWNRATGQFTLVSHRTNGQAGGVDLSGGGGLSADGSHAVFVGTLASFLTAEPQGGVYRWTRATDALQVVKVQSQTFRETSVRFATISDDDSTLAFASSDAAAPSDTGSDLDAFAWRSGDPFATLLSRDAAGTAVGGIGDGGMDISNEGRFVAFVSSADGITADPDGNAQQDVFLADIFAETMTLVSRGADGRAIGGSSEDPHLDATGHNLAFETNAAVGGPAGVDRVLLWERTTGTTVLASRTPTGGLPSDDSLQPRLAANGRALAFQSGASLAQADTNAESDVYAAALTPSPVTLVISDATISEDGNSVGVTVRFTGHGGPISFVMGTVDGTATAPGDFETRTGTVQVDQASPEVRVTQFVTIVDDDLSEGPETFRVVLSDVQGAVVGDGDATVTITDDEPPPPSVTIRDAAVVEDGGRVTVPIALSAASTVRVRVRVTTADVTARTPGDYTAVAATAEFAPGVTSGTVAVTIVDDATAEGEETFRVRLSQPEGATIARAEATVRITDDDAGAAPSPSPAPSAAPTQSPSTAPTVAPTAPPGESPPLVDLGFNDVVDLTTDSKVAAAIAFSQATFAGPVTGVLLASDTRFADALASGTLQSDRPLLLTDPNVLPRVVLDELLRLGATRVTILGGAAAVTEGLADDLRGRGVEVDRLAGPSRLETAVAVARTLPAADTAILARAFAAEGAADPTQAFADSLAAGGWAAATRWPLLFTETDRLSTSTRDHLVAAGIRTVHVVGGRGAVADQVLDELRALGIDARRVAGPSRFDTAVAIARARGFADGSPAGRVVLVDGQSADAWAAGFAAAAHAARSSAPVLLAVDDVVPEPSTAFLASTAVDADRVSDATPFLVCAAAARACEAARAAAGLPAAAVIRLDQNGASVEPGGTLTGTIDTGGRDATLTASGSCLGAPTPPIGIVDGTSFQIRLPDTAAAGACALTFALTFPNGSTQRAEGAITVT